MQYTLANAAEFSDMMAQRMGWRSYGDKQYVPHVLQYYAFGRIPTGIGNQAIVQVAASQEGKGGTVNTIEGNSGDKVARRSYRIGSSNIYGYGVPAY